MYPDEWTLDNFYLVVPLYGSDEEDILQKNCGL